MHSRFGMQSSRTQISKQVLHGREFVGYANSLAPLTKQCRRLLKTLVAAHLLRVTKRGQKNIYIARERMDVRIGDRVICTVVVDFVPATMRDKLAKLKGAASGEIEAADVWAEWNSSPAPAFLDASSGTSRPPCGPMRSRSK